MKKQIKKQIIEIIKTLYEAHRKIVDLLEEGATDIVFSLLCECQDAAIQIGNLIDETETNAEKTIKKLEDYCELLYTSSVNVGEMKPTEMQAALDHSLSVVEKSVENDIPSPHIVLMIAYYFPPLGGSGVYRSLKFAKYLPLFNWDAVVISAEKPPAGWNFADQSLTKEIPEGTTVYRLPDDLSQGKRVEFDPKRINNVFGFLREALCTDSDTIATVENVLKSDNGIKGMLTFPDACLTWCYDTSQYIENNLDITDYDAVYTTSGPYSAHIIGAYLKKKYGIPWIADYRDQWTGNPLIGNAKNSTVYKLLLRLEKNMLALADHNICVAPSAEKDYISRLKVPQSKISVITNGFDEDDFKEIHVSSVRCDKFTITFSGILYADSQTFAPILKALSDLFDDALLDRSEVRLQVIGSVDEKNETLIRSGGFGDIFEFKGYLAHRETLKYNLNSDILLIITGDDQVNKSWIPGKLFDYLRSGRPILSLTPKDGDAADIIRKSGSGETIHSSEISKIKEFILREYKKWKCGESLTHPTINAISDYERKKLAEKLADILDQNIWTKNRFEEFSSSIYNDTYKRSVEGKGLPYHLHYTQSNYYSSWQTAIRNLYLLDRSISILEIGCGSGQFASMLFDNGFYNYTGFDFSSDGIALAKKNNPENEEKFSIDDAFTTKLLEKKYDLVICFEVLEHLRKDLELLDRISSGTKVLLSVPNFNDPNHVRYFNTAAEVRERYKNHINIFDIQVSVIHEPYRLYYILGEKK